MSRHKGNMKSEYEMSVLSLFLSPLQNADCPQLAGGLIGIGGQLVDIIVIVPVEVQQSFIVVVALSIQCLHFSKSHLRDINKGVEICYRYRFSCKKR